MGACFKTASHPAGAAAWSSAARRGYRGGGGSGGVPAPYVGPLDGLATPPRAAYSTRKLLSAYEGNWVRLRRQSDDAEMDFGFVAATGLVDLAAVAAWAGGAANVVTWYDQSCNGFDVTQTTQASQPLFVAGESTLNGMPALDFDSDFMEFSGAAVLNTAAAFMYGTVSRNSDVSFARIISTTAAGQLDFTNPESCNLLSNSSTITAQRNSASSVKTGKSTGVGHVAAARFQADGTVTAEVNGVAGVPTLQAGTFNTINVRLGGRGPAHELFAGKIAEVVIINSDPHESYRSAIIAEAIAFYEVS